MRKLFFLLAIAVFAMVSCSKESRKVDQNDGSENPINRKLQVEVTHRYNLYEDSLLPNVAITLYESAEDEQAGRYYRRDTTNGAGMATFGQIKAGNFNAVLTHAARGTKRVQINIDGGEVNAYEYLYY